MTPLDQSPSETVRRHAETFRRTRTDDPDPGPDRSATSTRSVPTARPMTRAELGTARSPRAQAAKVADAVGWSWTAHRAEVPDGSTNDGSDSPGAWSVVMRFRLPGALPWTCRRAVASWRAPSAKSRLEFVDAYAWREVGPGRGERVEWERLAAGELAEHLWEAPRRTVPRRSPAT